MIKIPMTTTKLEYSIPCIPLDDCAAKTYNVGNIKHLGMSVLQHSLIVAVVAKELVKRLPLSVAEMYLPVGWLWTVGSHDIGKVSPGFQYNRLRNNSSLVLDKYGQCNDSLLIKSMTDESSNAHFIHSLISEAYIVKKLGLKSIARCAGNHHGSREWPDTGLQIEPYNRMYINGVPRPQFGDINWEIERDILFNQLISYLGNPPSTEFTLPQENFISGLISVSDWIGSDETWFHSAHRANFDTIESMEIFANQALDELGFTLESVVKGFEFGDIFNYNGHKFSPNKLQSKIAESFNGPGLYIIEGPMGIGKTEAALYLTYLMQSNSINYGMYFALPTQLTSNKIWNRVEEYVKTISPNFQSVKLAHGKSWLMDNHYDDNDSRYSVNDWHNNKKRALIYPYGCGTIDQALMSSIKSMHYFVRAFALTGKVIIIDEVHSYDAYTSFILQKFVNEMIDLGCTVIMLSATLSNNSKTQFGINNSKGYYPCITHVKNNVVTEHNVEIEELTKKVTLTTSSSNTQCIKDAMNKARNGYMVLWIENTVAEAQNIYDIFMQSGLETGLLHSKYNYSDRTINENKWVTRFGKGGNRSGCILVATQVAEQSLDIDCDVLYTRLCPIDMLLQRIGRMYRHDNIRPINSFPECVLMIPRETNDWKDWVNNMGHTVMVYQPYVLYRTYDRLKNAREINLPNDIRPLINDVYDNRNETDRQLREWKTAFDEVKVNQKGLALQAVNSRMSYIYEFDDDVESDGRWHSTRLGEMPTINIVLVKQFIRNGDSCIIEFFDSTELHTINVHDKKHVNIARLFDKYNVPLTYKPTSNKMEMIQIIQLNHVAETNDSKYLSQYFFGDVMVVTVKNKRLFYDTTMINGWEYDTIIGLRKRF